MAQKSGKKIVSKGDRLGWVPLDQAKQLKLSTLEIKGRRVNIDRSQQGDVSFLIP